MKNGTILCGLMAALLLAGCSLGNTAPEQGEAPPSQVVSSGGILPLQPTTPTETELPAPGESTPPEAEKGILLTADTLTASQGGLVLLRAKNLPDGVLPQAVTTMDFTPVFYAGENGMATALLPVRSRTNTGTYTVTVTAGEARQNFTFTVTDGGFHVEYIEMEQTIADSTLNNSTAADEFEELYQRMKSGVDAVYWQGEFIKPLVQESPRVSSDYGDTRYVNGVISGRHGGVDFPAPRGTTVMATNSGTVAFAGFMQQTGNTVCIEHGMGLKSWYFHMDSLACTTDETVEKGQKIGEVGTTGASTGNHLHFAFSVGGVYVNPWTIMEQGIPLEE